MCVCVCVCVREREKEREKEKEGEGDFYCVGFSPHHSSGSNTEMLQYMKLFLSLFRLLQQTNIDWVAYKQKSVSNSSGDREVQNQGVGRSGESLLPCS